MLKAITLALTLVATPLAAEADACSQMGTMAAKIMEVRQIGVAVSKVIEIFDDDAMTAIILAAYQVPRFSTDEYQQRAIADFRNEVEVMCYEAK